MSFNDAVLSVNFYTPWGQGYVALNWLLGQFSKDSVILFSTLAVLSVGGVMLYYWKTAYLPLLAVMLYLLYPMMYIMGFGVVRQHLAVVFILWALYYVDNLKLSLPLAIIGTLCHTSAVIFVPYFLVKNIVLSRLSSVKLIVFSIAGVIVLSLAAGFVVSFSSRYEEIYESASVKNNIVPVIIIGSVIIMFMLMGLFKRVRDAHDLQVMKYLIYGFVIALFSMGTKGTGRLTMFFIYVVPVAVGLLFKYSVKSNKGLAYVYTIGLFLIFSVLAFLNSSNYEVYKFFWENV